MQSAAAQAPQRSHLTGATQLLSLLKERFGVQRNSYFWLLHELCGVKALCRKRGATSRHMCSCLVQPAYQGAFVSTQLGCRLVAASSMSSAQTLAAERQHRLSKQAGIVFAVLNTPQVCGEYLRCELPHALSAAAALQGSQHTVVCQHEHRRLWLQDVHTVCLLRLLPFPAVVLL
jgi:hypothetical protein